MNGEAKRHELRCWPAEFWNIVAGKKRAEFRRDDRVYRVGDTLELQEYDPVARSYSGYFVRVTVTHKLPGGSFGVPVDFCVLSIARESGLLHSVVLANADPRTVRSASREPHGTGPVRDLDPQRYAEFHPRRSPDDRLPTPPDDSSGPAGS